jgi:hypothetical protein
MKLTLEEQIDRYKKLMQINEGFVDKTKNLAKDVLGIKNTEEKKLEALHYIQSGKNQNITMAYNKFQQEDPVKADKYVQFYVENPNDFPKWDGDQFIPTGSIEMTR